MVSVETCTPCYNLPGFRLLIYYCYSTFLAKFQCPWENTSWSLHRNQRSVCHGLASRYLLFTFLQADTCSSCSCKQIAALHVLASRYLLFIFLQADTCFSRSWKQKPVCHAKCWPSDETYILVLHSVFSEGQLPTWRCTTVAYLTVVRYTSNASSKVFIRLDAIHANLI